MKRVLLTAICVSLLSGQPGFRSYFENQFQRLPEAARIGVHIERMSRQPHHAGSPGSKAVAEYAAGQFREWGLQTQIEVFEAMLPQPLRRELEMVSPVKFRARLQEPPLAEDKDSGDAGQLPTYNAYSGSGEVTAPLVYVNYGIPEDYETLSRLGIDVKGKIVLARYGKSWRGTKPKVAQEHGAVGCLIYSDPREDGYFQGDAYPKGPFRPENGVQRGSVLDMPLFVGDPLSPGWASEAGSRRLKPEEASNVMKIPVLPIAYGDARPLLANLGGPVAPEAWRGALALTYRIGPGPATVRLRVEADTATRPVYDVIARIPGARFPDQWVIYGNHHDAWVNGAADPVSGAAVLLETARSLAALAKEGWRPDRTVILALWDAEEFGLIGSTEWVEKHREELERGGIAYLNSDTNGRGKISAQGSPLLLRFLEGVLDSVPQPGGAGSVLEAARRGDGKDRPPGFRMGAPGAGSDYVAFVHQAGIPCLNLGFTGGDQGGVYHSVYDTWEWYKRFSDADFSHGRALALVMGRALIRLADAPQVPVEAGSLAAAVTGYVAEIRKVSGEKVNFGPLLEALARVETQAKHWDRVRTRPTTPQRLLKINRLLAGCERALTLPSGLPGRPWYRHQIYAPGLYTGYSAKTLPGIREAAEAERWTEANAQAGQVAKVLHALADTVAAAVAELE